MDGLDLAQLQASAGVSFAAVVVIVAVYLIARVARVPAPAALLLGLSPMALALVMDVAILPAAGLA